MSHSPEPVALDMVDWPDAARIGSLLVPPGPQASRSELTDLVAILRAAAHDAVGPLMDVTSMRPAPGRSLPGERWLASAHDSMQDSTQDDAPYAAPAAGSDPRIVVVDRANWIGSTTAMLQQMTAGLTDSLPRAAVPQGVAARLLASAQVGATLAFLAPRVLGQFDPYAQVTAPAASGRQADGASGLPQSVNGLGDADVTGDAGASDSLHRQGRLLLIAPNLLATARSLEVNAQDFYLWVCLHEQTHALQFACAPWLADHLQAKITKLLTGFGQGLADQMDAPWGSKVKRRVTSLASLVNSVAGGADRQPLAHLLTPELRQIFEDITAVMSLLEGHADVMMDAAGPGVVPSLELIRARFERRRDASRGLDAIIRKVMGMDMKLAQYRNGAAFVRGVHLEVGQQGLDTVWLKPENLPTVQEIAEPGLWVRRVHG